MDPENIFDPDLDAELDEAFQSFNVPPAVVELEVPTTSRAVDDASPPLIVGFSHEFIKEAPSTSRIFEPSLPLCPPPLPPPPPPLPSSASSASSDVASPSASAAPTSKRRRQYEPDPIRGTSQHTVKRARNNAAVRKSRAKASETAQAQDTLNQERRRQTELFRNARANLTEMVRIFKENIFDRSPGAQAQQKELSEGLLRINAELKDQGLPVPDLDLT